MLLKQSIKKGYSVLGSKIPQRDFRAAVVLSGCGVNDGSEITESVSMLIAISKYGGTFDCFAPDKEQSDVIDHVKGQPVGGSRNVMIEASRIARGNIKDITQLAANNYDAVFMPGGFGAAKNLSDFATKGADMSVIPELEKILKEFHSSKKPIGLCCISPVLAARVFGTKKGGPGVQLTLGGKGQHWPFGDALDASQGMGNTIVQKDVEEICVDKDNRIVTAPAYMKADAKPNQVYNGIDSLVREISKMIK